MPNSMPQVPGQGRMLHEATCSFPGGEQPPEPRGDPENQGFIPSLASLVLPQTRSTLCLESLVPWHSRQHHLLATGTKAAEPGDSLPGRGWMAALGSVSAAFQEYLRHLGLQDFPCGLGSWVRVWGGVQPWDMARGCHCLSSLPVCRTNPASMPAGAPRQSLWGWRRPCHQERRPPRRCWSC